jgi:hypothetical protein
MMCPLSLCSVSVRRCQELNKLLVEHNFPSMAIYGGLSQDERLDRYNKFKEYKGQHSDSGRGLNLAVRWLILQFLFSSSHPGVD